MKNSDSIQTSEQSLEIISRMVQQTQGNMRAGSFHFILWGLVAIVCNLGHYFLATQTDYPHPYIIWVLAIPAWIASMWYGKKQSQKAHVVTYSQKIIMWLWIGFGISLILIIFSGRFGDLITPLVLVLVGLATFVTGNIIRFKPLIIGGSLFWIFAVIAFTVSTEHALLVSAIAITCGYLIPGFMLKNQNQK